GQGLTIPLHLGSVPTALREVLERFEGDIHPGDLFILNDPYAGGMHLPDVFIFKPIFCDGERLAFAATVCHHVDVGGRVPGSNASDSTEIYQEGLR
ncbi:MAG TPA: 5-oxoprolinase, partial [Candidatus Latescibacteria bacterium]|nr:5-oxoprolinase [Candidatus Latescibacterota bacterium]